MIKLRQPYCFSDIGRKDNQEDYICPSGNISQGEKCFVLCDGVGGNNKGEVASKTIAEAIYSRYHERVSQGQKNTPEELIEYAASVLDRYYVEDEEKPMATTLVLVMVDDSKVTVAHIGDSRAYLVSPSRKKIAFRTEDHAIPNTHIITKALQPCVRYEPSIKVVTPQDGDYIFLCSDGVLENVTDEKLLKILSDNQSDAEKIGQIHQECIDKTRDNNTAILIPVDKGVGSWEGFLRTIGLRK